MKKRQRKFLRNIFRIFFLIMVVIALILGAKLYLPSFEKIDYRDSVKLAKDEIGINMQLDYIPMKNIPLSENGEIYLPVDFVKKYIDNYIYWDEQENTLTITNEHNVIRMKTDELEYFINNEP